MHKYQNKLLKPDANFASGFYFVVIGFLNLVIIKVNAKNCFIFGFSPKLG